MPDGRPLKPNKFKGYHGRDQTDHPEPDRHHDNPVRRKVRDFLIEIYRFPDEFETATWGKK